MNMCYICENNVISVAFNAYKCKICNLEYFFFNKKEPPSCIYKIIYNVNNSIYEWIYSNVFCIDEKRAEHPNFGNINNKEDIIKFKKYIDNLIFA